MKRISNKCEAIGWQAFKNCTLLVNVKISYSSITFYSNCFEGCSSLTSFKFQSSVASIPESMFLNCTSLEYVSIPVSITVVEANAFSGCTSLNDVYYAADESYWEQITINATGNIPLTNATKHYSSDGPIQ